MKKIKLVLIFTIVFLTSTAHLKAQFTFQSSFTANTSGAQGTHIIATSDSGYLIVANSFMLPNALYIVKTDKTGDSIWTNIVEYHGTGIAGGYQYGLQTMDDGYLVGGTIGDSLGNEISLLRLNNNGDTIWTKEYRGGILPIDNNLNIGGLKETTEGGFIVSGTNQNYYDNRWSAFLMKLNSAGDTVWTRLYRSAAEIDIYDLQITPDGGYIICGRSNAPGGAGFFDLILMKTDSAGTVQWAKLYGGYDDDEGYTVVPKKSGGYMFTGKSNSWTAYPYPNELFIGTTDANGNLLWSRTYYTGDMYAGYQTSDGGYMIAGQHNYATIIKTDSTGLILWAKQYDTSQYTSFNNLTKTLDGGIAAIGEGSNGIYPFIYFAKTDSLGNIGSCNGSSLTLTETYPSTLTHNYIDTEMAISPSIYCNPKEIKRDGIYSNICAPTNAPSIVKRPEHPIILYPNPSTGTFTLQTEGAQNFASATIEIYNVLGQKVETQCIASLPKLSINLTNQPNGIYFYRVLNENRSVLGSGKIIVQK